MAKGGLSIDIKIFDMKEFKAFVACVKEITDDERIPEDIRQEYIEKITASLPPYREEITLYSNSGPCETITKEDSHND